MPEPRNLIERLERQPALPKGEGERFSGYGVMSCPFASGDILCHRRFPASSVGPAYTSIWHRDPTGEWRFYQDVEPRRACSRFFGAELAGTVETPIETTWTAARELRLTVPGRLEWELSLGSTIATRAMNAMGSVMPDALWKSPAVLRVMALVAGRALGAGKLRLAGRSPNGQRFVANPLLIWTIPRAYAVIDGRDFGAVQATAAQAKLGDFWIPRRGLFVIGRAFFDAFDPARHSSATSRAG